MPSTRVLPRSDEFAAPDIAEGFSRLAQMADSTLAAQKERLGPELVARVADLSYGLKRLAALFTRLVAINHQLAAEQVPQIEIDDGSGELVIRLPDGTAPIRLAIPNASSRSAIGNFKVAHRAGGPGLPGTNEASGIALRAELEDRLRQFYYDAFRVLKIAEKLPPQKKFPFCGVTMVRNDLLEHPKDVKVALNFGHGTGGPFVRPLRSESVKHDDAGLLANSSEFLKMLNQRLEGL